MAGFRSQPSAKSSDRLPDQSRFFEEPAAFLRARHEVLAAGEVAEWNPVFGAGLKITGRDQLELAAELRISAF
jgi:hypothetical protein